MRRRRLKQAPGLWSWCITTIGITDTTITGIIATRNWRRASKNPHGNAHAEDELGMGTFYL